MFIKRAIMAVADDISMGIAGLANDITGVWSTVEIPQVSQNIKQILLGKIPLVTHQSKYV